MSDNWGRGYHIGSLPVFFLGFCFQKEGPPLLDPVTTPPTFSYFFGATFPL